MARRSCVCLCFLSSSSPLSLSEQIIQSGIDVLLANVAPLRTIVSHDPVSPVLSHDLDSVYRSSLHSIVQRHEREVCQEVGYTPRLLIAHFHLRFPHSSSASRFTAGAAGFLNLSQC